LVLLSCSAAPSRTAETPVNGFVPDAQTAIRIAEAVLTPIYGESAIAADQPFTATLKGDVWIVVGSVGCAEDHREQRTSSADSAAGTNSNDEYLCVGGTGSARISRRSGQILEVSHTQ
jgi:hypothetical protein